MTEERPNILFITTDQQRFDSLGCYGSRVVPTPNLDRLAAGGARFETCYVNNPLCTPSRASMMTGKHLPGHGVYRLYDDLGPDQIHFPVWLRESGYRTALVGKLHTSSITAETVRRHPNDGFDVYDWCIDPGISLDSEFNAFGRWLGSRNPELRARATAERARFRWPIDENMTAWCATRTIELFREQRHRPDPLFCFLSVFDPHPYYHDAAKEMLDLVDYDAIEDAVLVEAELENGPAVLRRFAEDTGSSVPVGATPEDFRDIRANYHATIALVDHHVGRVLDVLEETGQAENTLIVFTSDHGDMLGDHHQVGKGGFFYDPCTRVPCIVRWPAKFDSKVVSNARVQPHDVCATFLSAAGYDDDFISLHAPDSRSMLPLCVGGADPGNDFAQAVCVYRNSGLSRDRTEHYYFVPPIHGTMLRSGRYKLNLYHNLDSGGLPEGQLFDMEADPLETVDLWSSRAHEATRADLTAELASWLARQEWQNLGSRGGNSKPMWWNR